MANKMTKKDYFARLLTLDAVKADSALVDFINHEVDLLNRKNSGEKKPTAQQKENEAIKDNIVALMTANPNRIFTITEIQKNAEGCAEFTGQRISALVRQLKEEGKVVRTEEKRKAYFSLAK